MTKKKKDMFLPSLLEPRKAITTEVCSNCSLGNEAQRGICGGTLGSAAVFDAGILGGLWLVCWRLLQPGFRLMPAIVFIGSER